MDETVARLDVDRVRTEDDRYGANQISLTLWSRDFFRQVAARLTVVEEEGLLGSRMRRGIVAAVAVLLALYVLCLIILNL